MNKAYTQKWYKNWNATTRPMESVHIDFLLFLWDSYSKWIELKQIKSTTTEETIKNSSWTELKQVIRTIAGKPLHM